MLTVRLGIVAVGSRLVLPFATALPLALVYLLLVTVMTTGSMPSAWMDRPDGV